MWSQTEPAVPAVDLEVDNPAPVIASLSPSAALAGTASAQITFTGTGFVPSTVINVNGSGRATTYIDSTQVSAALPSADFSVGGSLSITAVNTTPGGGASAAVTLVNNPAPGFIRLSPSTLNVGASSAATITVTGIGFVSAFAVQVSGTARPTTYVNSMTLTFAATSADQATAAILPVKVVNPAPGGGTSAAASLNIIVQPATPVITTMPSRGPIDTASAETLNGTGFTTNTTVVLNGVTIPSGFVSSTGITANFPASALATPGNQIVTVTTPAPGGATSAAQDYATFLSIPINDIVYNAADGLIYASVPATAVGAIGNAVVGIDQNTGSITRTIQTGTKPNKLALSSDGTQLFVGIDGAAAVAQVNLARLSDQLQQDRAVGPERYRRGCGSECLHVQ